MDAMSESCKTFAFLVCGITTGIIAILGISGILTSFIVLRNHKEQASTILLYRCLGCSDILLLVVSLLTFSVPVIGRYTAHNVTSYNLNVNMYLVPLGMMAHMCTVWLTVVITVHRFIFVCRPHSIYTTHSHKILRILVLAMVLLSITMNIPMLFKNFSIPHGNEVAVNTTLSVSNLSRDFRDLDNRNDHLHAIDHLFYQVIYSKAIYCPVIYIVPLMSLIYFASRTNLAMKDFGQRKTKQKLQQQARHATRQIILIVVVFILCQTPVMIREILLAVLDRADSECGHFLYYYAKMCDLLVVMNSSVNFIIYYLFGKRYRKIFSDAFCQNVCVVQLHGKCRAISAQCAEKNLVKLTQV